MSESVTEEGGGGKSMRPLCCEIDEKFKGKTFKAFRITFFIMDNSFSRILRPIIIISVPYIPFTAQTYPNMVPNVIALGQENGPNRI